MSKRGRAGRSQRGALDNVASQRIWNKSGVDQIMLSVEKLLKGVRPA